MSATVKVLTVHICGEDRPVRIELRSSLADTARRIRQAGFDAKDRNGRSARQPKHTAITRNLQNEAVM